MSFWDLKSLGLPILVSITSITDFCLNIAPIIRLRIFPARSSSIQELPSWWAFKRSRITPLNALCINLQGEDQSEMFRRCWLNPPCLLANPYFNTQALGHLFIRLLLLKDQIFGRLAFAALCACINLWHCLNGCQSFVSIPFTRVAKDSIHWGLSVGSKLITSFRIIYQWWFIGWNNG